MAIFVYEDNRGNVPFYEWRDNIAAKDPSIYRKVQDMIQMMRDQNLPLTRPLVKRMLLRLPYRNLYKIRLGKYRLMFLADDGDYYLLHAFRKTTQQTPERERHIVSREIERHHYLPYEDMKEDK